MHPPYHPKSNPIQPAWGIVKGHIAIENDGLNFGMAKTFIYQGFDKVTSDVRKELIENSIDEEMKCLYHDGINMEELNLEGFEEHFFNTSSLPGLIREAMDERQNTIDDDAKANHEDEWEEEDMDSFE